MDAAELILEKIICQGDQVIDDRATVVLVVPNACCGALIGKGGTIIKSLAIESNAGIMISPHDICYGLQDRLVVITGHLENQLQAIFLILSELLEDYRYSCPYAGVPFPHHVSSVWCEDHGSDEHVERYHSRPNTPKRSPDNNDDAHESLTIAIADEHIGAVIGRGGRKIKEIMKVSGAWIKTSAKGDFIAGTSDREVVISGTPEVVYVAEAMIMHVVSAARRRQSGGSGERPPLEPDATPQQLEASLEQDRSVSWSKKAPAPVLPIESWTESDELDTEDGENVYFRVLVDKFIAAAYPRGMNGVVATVHGQQEAATTPRASTRSMEAQAARQVAALEGAKAVVSTGCGVGSASLVAKTVLTRMAPRERYTWKYQTTEDGPNGLTVLSNVKKQPIKDSCMPTATAAVIESNLRVQLNKNTLLSLEYLIHLSKVGRTKFPNEAAMKCLFLMLRDEGVLTEVDYENLQRGTARDVRRYRITKDYYYAVDNAGNMRHALYKLRNEGPLMGVIKISKNYDDCFRSGHIYKYDPDRDPEDEEGNPKATTHAVCIISFAIEKEVPFLECQDSHGERFGNKGFINIDVTSLSHLWSIVVA